MSLAKSLVCNECGLQMRTAQAATSHAMSTGHTDFAESVEAVKEITCATCGKKCQSSVEVEQHKRATGHGDFSDNTKHDGPGVDLSMGPADTGASDAARKINGIVFAQVLEMGFGESRVKHAMLGGCTTVESAVGWLSERIDDASLDVEPTVPVVVDNTPPKAELTEEEKQKKVDEMKQRIHDKKMQKAADDQLANAEKEKERIASQKMMAEQRVLHEEHKRKMAYDQMKREKEADRKAKEKILLELAVDKAVKMGAEPAKARTDAIAEFERKHHEAEQAKLDALKAAEAAPVRSTAPMSEWKLGGEGSGPVAVPLMDNVAAARRVELPPPSPESFEALAATIAPDKRADIATLLRQVLQSPLDAKKRQLKIHNAAVGRVLPSPEAVNYVRLAGFKIEGDELRMTTVAMRRVAMAVNALETP